MKKPNKITKKFYELKIIKEYDSSNNIFLIRKNNEWNEIYHLNWQIIFNKEEYFYNEFTNIDSLSIGNNSIFYIFRDLFKHLEKINDQIKDLPKNLIIKLNCVRKNNISKFIYYGYTICDPNSFIKDLITLDHIDKKIICPNLYKSINRSVLNKLTKNKIRKKAKTKDFNIIKFNTNVIKELNFEEPNIIYSSLFKHYSISFFEFKRLRKQCNIPGYIFLDNVYQGSTFNYKNRDPFLIRKIIHTVDLIKFIPIIFESSEKKSIDYYLKKGQELLSKEFEKLRINKRFFESTYVSLRRLIFSKFVNIALIKPKLKLITKYEKHLYNKILENHDKIYIILNTNSIFLKIWKEIFLKLFSKYYKKIEFIYSYDTNYVELAHFKYPVTTTINIPYKNAIEQITINENKNQPKSIKINILLKNIDLNKCKNLEPLSRKILKELKSTNNNKNIENLVSLHVA